MHPVGLVVLAAYMLLLLGMGIRFRRGQTTTDSYFVAGRSIPGWAAGVSLLATIITSVTFTGDLRAVIWADVVQSLLLWACVTVSLHNYPEYTGISHSLIPAPARRYRS